MNIEDICKQYWEGIIWVTKYYFNIPIHIFNNKMKYSCRDYKLNKVIRFEHIEKIMELNINFLCRSFFSQ